MAVSANTVNNPHPEYGFASEDWILMRDSYKGEKQIKLKGEKYLPATNGQIIDGMKVGQDGYTSYSSYKQRAVYPDLVHSAVEIYVGLLHYKESQYIVPPEMEFILERATVNGESLAQLHRKINLEQVVTGRNGILIDIDNLSGNPYFAHYTAESIINWDVGTEQVGLNALNLVVLDETHWLRKGFGWNECEQYRVLTLGDLIPNEESNNGYAYTQSVHVNSNINDNSLELLSITPKYKSRTLDEIPFIFINSKNISSDIDEPPLLGLAHACLAIYRGEADYRQALHMTGQDTLVVKGSIVNQDPDSAIRIGTGARIDVDISGDAKFIGINSSGIPEMRQCLQNDREHALTKAGQLFNSSSKQESGDALKIRMASQMANLYQVAITSAYGLEQGLKKMARWMGLDDSQVKVIPNLQFAEKDMRGQDFAQLLAAKMTSTLPLCDESVHDILKSQGFTKMDYEDERLKMEDDIISGKIVIPNLSQQASQSVGVHQPTANMSSTKVKSKPVTTKQQPLN